MAVKLNQQEDQCSVDLVKPNDTFIPITQTGKQVGKGKSWIYEKISEGKFPTPIKLGRSTCFSQNAINDWMDKVKAGEIQL